MFSENVYTSFLCFLQFWVHGSQSVDRCCNSLNWKKMDGNNLDGSFLKNRPGFFNHKDLINLLAYCSYQVEVYTKCFNLLVYTGKKGTQMFSSRGQGRRHLILHYRAR